MQGHIEPGQIITVAPTAPEQVKVGEIVFCRIDRKNVPRYMTHLVKDVLTDGFLICNARGRENGVARKEHVYGVVSEVAWPSSAPGFDGHAVIPRPAN